MASNAQGGRKLFSFGLGQDLWASSLFYFKKVAAFYSWGACFVQRFLTCHLPEWFSPDLEQEELDETKDLEVSSPSEP